VKHLEGLTERGAVFPTGSATDQVAFDASKIRTSQLISSE